MRKKEKGGGEERNLFFDKTDLPKRSTARTAYWNRVTDYLMSYLIFKITVNMVYQPKLLTKKCYEW